MSNLELQTSRTTSASRTPLPKGRGAKTDAMTVTRDRSNAKSDVARQQAWLLGIEAEDFYANVPCTD